MLQDLMALIRTRLLYAVGLGRFHPPRYDRAGHGYGWRAIPRRACVSGDFLTLDEARGRLERTRTGLERYTCLLERSRVRRGSEEGTWCRATWLSSGETPWRRRSGFRQGSCNGIVIGLPSLWWPFAMASATCPSPLACAGGMPIPTARPGVVATGVFRKGFCGTILDLLRSEEYADVLPHFAYSCSMSFFNRDLPRLLMADPALWDATNMMLCMPAIQDRVRECREHAGQGLGRQV